MTTCICYTQLALLTLTLCGIATPLIGFLTERQSSWRGTVAGIIAQVVWQQMHFQSLGLVKLIGFFLLHTWFHVCCGTCQQEGEWHLGSMGVEAHVSRKGEWHLDSS